MGQVVRKKLRIRSITTSNGNNILGFIGKGLEIKHREDLLQMYGLWWGHTWNTGCGFCPLTFQKPDNIEEVLWSVSWIRGLPCNDKPDSLDLYSMEFRKMRSDLVQIYKIVKGLDGQNIGMLWQVRVSQTRKNKARLGQLNVRSMEKMVNLWVGSGSWSIGST